MSADTLTTLLNKLYAMWRAKIVTLREIGKQIGHHETRVSEWITRRTKKPSTDIFFKLQTLAAKLTLRIAKDPQQSADYRREFRLVTRNGIVKDESVLTGLQKRKPERAFIVPKASIPALQKAANRAGIKISTRKIDSERTRVVKFPTTGGKI